MRHFSGELDGLRLLMADELELIAGGDGEDTDDVPEPPPTRLDEVVVNAHVTYYDLALGQLYHFYGTGGQPTGGSFNYYPGQPGDCHLTQVEFDETATADPATQGQAATFSAAIETHSDRMRAIPDALTIYYPNSPTTVFTTGAELRQLWSMTDFVVTGGQLGGIAAGTADRNGGNPILSIEISEMSNFMSDGARQAYYFFHELVHTTLESNGMYNEAYAAWQSNPQGVGFQQSSYFINNERAVNTVAANLASLFGIDVKAAVDAPHGYLAAGYETTGSGQLTPDSANSGPGGTC